MNTIEEIIAIARRFALARGKLIGRCSLIQRVINRLKANNLPILRRYADETGETYTALAAAIESSRELFRKPKTIEVDGIKFGLRKQKGKMTWDDEEKVLERIKKTYGAKSSLIRIKEAPDKACLEQLPAKDLKALGITITDDTDAVAITCPDTEVEKLAAAFLAVEEKATD